MNAKADQVLDGLARFDVVHLGCHGVFELGQPLDSNLRWADRAVTLREVTLRLRQSPCSVIVLSACEAGIGHFDPARESGFPSVLLRAGCGQVVAARWAVDDVATALLMGVVHQELARGRPAVNALADAQNWLRTAPGGLLGMLAQTWFPWAREQLDPRDVPYVEGRIQKLVDLGEQAPFGHLAESAAFACNVDRVCLTS
jgi:CHAT domain-containing protein